MALRIKTINIHGRDYHIPPRGLYAGTPGKGPEGKECRHCAHRRHVEHARTYNKCGLMEKRWTGGGATDIKATAPACERFKEAELG